MEELQHAVDTATITRKSHDLMNMYVTEIVRDQFTRETERLKLRRVTLADLGGSKGQIRHRPSLLGTTLRAGVDEVLSEGEQTAIGLAGFFTEAEFDESLSALILDDPVTSLDHVRRSLVATRLVELADKRQVIVFTHEVAFVGDLVKSANENGVVLSERAIERVGEQPPGKTSDKFPWKARDVGSRLGKLDQMLAEIKRNVDQWDADEYETHVAEWAGALSETWERAVNLDIVQEVVDQGTSQVRPLKFRIFAAVTAVDNTDYQAGYDHCSEWARRHDKAPARYYVAPDVDDLEAELARFRTWYARIKSYKNA